MNYTSHINESCPIQADYKCAGYEWVVLTHWHVTNECVMLQLIPLGMTFSNAVSKLKAHSSNVSFATLQ